MTTIHFPTLSKTDGFPTPTSDEQYATELLLRQFSSSSSSTPNPHPPFLDRNAHINFLVRILIQGLPKRYTAQDASQPWILFWTLQSISLLGVGLDEGNKQRIIDTTLLLQHPQGGFAGGPYQFPHLLPTYAAICTLAIVGRPGPGGGWDEIDRDGIYRFFMEMKQEDGSFLVGKDMEVDIRGTYCLLAVATLLDILTPELTHNTGSFIASLQTYEGGFASSSSSSPSSSSPLGEAHGGYTYCALASWLLLKQASLLPSDITIDLSNLTRWLVHLQESVFGLGGFRGRTNKLVDGCYGWWVGGCFDLIRALGVPVPVPVVDSSLTPSGGDEDETDWEDEEDSLYDTRGLQAYILYAAQSESGGLRDKPKKAADAYHTLYNLAGLSSSQHRMRPDRTVYTSLLNKYRFPPGGEGSKGEEEERRKREVWARMLSWIEHGGDKDKDILGGKVNRVNGTHPLVNLTMTHVKGIMNHFYQQNV